MSRQRTHKRSLLLATFLLAFLIGGMLVTVRGAAQISPSSGRYEVDIPIHITVEGLEADTRYTVYEVQDGTDTLVVNMTSSTDGKLMTSVIFDETGEGSIEVRDHEGSDVEVSATFLIVDSFNDEILPILIFAITMGLGVIVVIGLFKRIKTTL